MPVTFGSVGDIISVCGLIKQLKDTLSDTKGSSADFQATARDLANLEAALRELHELAEVCERVGGYQSLRQRALLEALECRKPISDFSESIQKYKRSLRHGGSGNSVKDTVSKEIENGDS